MKNKILILAMSSLFIFFGCSDLDTDLISFEDSISTLIDNNTTEEKDGGIIISIPWAEITSLRSPFEKKNGKVSDETFLTSFGDTALQLIDNHGENSSRKSFTTHNMAIAYHIGGPYNANIKTRTSSGKIYDAKAFSRGTPNTWGRASAHGLCGRYETNNHYNTSFVKAGAKANSCVTYGQ